MPSDHIDQQAANDSPPALILRGVRKTGKGHETNVLLFRGKGDYLQGFVTVGGEKRHVLAHLNQRKRDPQTGEAKPNFISLSEPRADGARTDWRQVGYGNAVNRRADGKPVYFDEVILNIGNHVLRARITQNVDAQLHRQLGFLGERQERPKPTTQLESSEFKSSQTPGESHLDAATNDSLSANGSESPEPHEKQSGTPEARSSMEVKVDLAPSETKSPPPAASQDASAQSSRRRRSPGLAN